MRDADNKMTWEGTDSRFAAKLSGYIRFTTHRQEWQVHVDDSGKITTDTGSLVRKKLISYAPICQRAVRRVILRNMYLRALQIAFSLRFNLVCLLLISLKVHALRYQRAGCFPALTNLLRD